MLIYTLPTLHIHPSLLEMAEPVEPAEVIPPEDGAAMILFTQTLLLPTLEEVHERFDAHFEELYRKGDPLAGAKEASFYEAIARDLARIGPTRRLVIHCPYLAIVPEI